MIFQLTKKLMPNYKIIVEYDGAKFVGWQKQENGQSIQEALENSIKKFSSEKVNVYGAGRTDSGVHSRGQVAHFKINKNFPLEKIIGALNQHLKPLPIAVLNVQEVDENFHARFSAKLRSYKYFIINRKVPLTINRNHAWCVFKKLNIDDMKYAAKFFEGKHDFNAFRSIDCQSSTSIKTIKSCTVENNQDEIYINVSAKSFLHSQVRIIVGTLVEIGKGKIIRDDIKKIIKNKDRKRAGPTAPAHGLYLIKVEY